MPARSMIIMAAAGILLAGAPARAGDQETVVRLYPSAVVTSDQVTLKDIADIAGDAAELAGAWSLVEAPAVGAELTIDTDAVQRILARRGMNASNWVFRGSLRCKVTRVRGSVADRTEDKPVESKPAPKARRNSASAKAPTSMPAGGLAAANKPAVDPNTLDGAIQDYLTRKLSPTGGRPAVQYNPAQRDLLNLSRPSYDFTIAQQNPSCVGLVPLDVTIYRDGKLSQVQSILVQVKLVRSVVVASRALNRGQILRGDDVILQERTFEQENSRIATDVNAFINQRAIRFINKDEMLTTKDIEPLPLILRNDLVSVVAHRGGVSITGSAKAMTAGGYGQVIQLRNEVSKQTFSAIVTGPKTVELIRDSVPQAAQVRAETIKPAGEVN